MTTFQAGDITLTEVREHVWELERSGEMRVPARVLASETLLEKIAEDKTLEQLRNTTHLPGIQQHAICMPDGHQGYGFPVGGVAGIDAEEGCISPGAVGYDINCLSGDTSVLLSFGRRLDIAELRDRFEDDEAVVVGDAVEDAPIQLLTVSHDELVYEVTVESGDVIRTTADHRFATPGGKVPLSELGPEDQLMLHHFTGLEDEQPEEFTVVDESDFEDEDPQQRRFLSDLGLLPLRSTDDAFHRLLKLVGFHTGHGAFGSEGQTWFHGEPEDLESIRADIEALGITPSRIHRWHRTHETQGKTIDRTEYSMKTTSKAFRKLLQLLGAPRGPNVESSVGTPWYFDRLAGWQQALYLSSLFGAEMSTPTAVSKTNFSEPEITHTRLREVADAGVQFFEDISKALNDLGIETSRIGRRQVAGGADDRPCDRLRLGIKSDADNLVQFFTTVGYRYNRTKQRRAILATEYLKRRASAIRRRTEAASEIKAVADGGDEPPGQLNAEYGVNDRYLQRYERSDVETRHRPPAEFPSFEEFVEQNPLTATSTVPSRIVSIEPLRHETVYDLGVDHDDHTFVADGFVVANCGVRMVRTDLTYDDITGREQELVDALFEAIPSGLGKGGVVQTDMATVDVILDRGLRWAVDNGYGVERDLLACEDEGVRPESDPATVSDEAKQRGKNQIGSLGSGNHFLEVQRVTDLFDEAVAEAYGLSVDQLVVLIHCGSRGLGHQVCTDYLRRIERTHADLLEQLPDRELAAAPAGSQLAEDYYQALGAAINFAWVNRQLVMHRTREVFADVFDRDGEDMGMELLYDVAHNIAKREVHDVGDEERELFVHRKGATRAFPAGHPDVPTAYRDVGQPIIIPGSMGAGSYVLRGGERSMDLTFGSTAHGAGRTMSRTQAKNEYWGETVRE
ncbi:MAG: RtcB family protein, partial [Halobacteriota archaeon]